MTLQTHIKELPPIDIRQRFDEESSLWDLDVLISDSWFRVSSECTREASDCVLNLLKAWRGEALTSR